MQDIVDFLKKNIVYVLIALLAYFAGDQKLLQEISQKFQEQLPRLSASQKSTPSKEGESPNFPFSINKGNEKIYIIGKFKVTYVVDGDTFHAKDENGEEKTVRIMAVNTLEMKETDANKLCFAKKQTAFTKDYLLNRDVYLYADKTQGLYDKYERILAYVATSSENYIDVNNNYFYNDYLVETGNADIYRASPPAILFNRFTKKTEFAKREKLGMWSEELCK